MTYDACLISHATPSRPISLDGYGVSNLHDVGLKGSFEETEQHRVVMKLSRVEAMIVEVRKQRNALATQTL